MAPAHREEPDLKAPKEEAEAESVVPAERLVDDCRGDVLLSLDALGPKATTGAPPPGTPPDDEELRRFIGGGNECRRLAFA